MTVADLLTDDRKAGMLAASIGGALLLIATLGELSSIARAQLESAAYMLLSFVPMAFGRAAITPKKKVQEDAHK